jgi:chromosome segregation protein
MRLESVSLHGFKSFAEKSVLKVMPGITAIVGPNGCGKSNISESVRWALGEQSAKSLRGGKMEDLIFHGSASRKPVGLAEVELTFSNDGVLSVPWTEVSVSRRLYRTGESEYYLNKNLSRLRDILDLFAGTGANPRAYSVMDQDKLNHVLTAKPHERRVFIEEAAGIAATSSSATRHRASSTPPARTSSACATSWTRCAASSPRSSARPRRRSSTRRCRPRSAIWPWRWCRRTTPDSPPRARAWPPS